MIQRPILERIETWYNWAKATGIVLTRIVVHPEDFGYAPKEYMGLPVVPLTGHSIASGRDYRGAPRKQSTYKMGKH